MLPAGATVQQARRAVASALRSAGIETPELDARLLVGHVLGLDHTGLATAAAQTLTPRQSDAVEGLAGRRLAHEPVARILGEKEFWGLAFEVTPAVLVPRPDTETVVEAALHAIDATGRRYAPIRIADLGTGSGALLLALLSELPAATGVGTDRSLDALMTARHNAERLGLNARSRFVACDYGQAIVTGCDLVVTNPPYIATVEIATLAPEVRTFDPVLALDGGGDGLDAYRVIAADAVRLLAPGGVLVTEIGLGQAAAVAALFEAAGLACDARVWPDLAGIDRAVVVRRTTCYTNANSASA